jgi:hypothetical protein
MARWLPWRRWAPWLGEILLVLGERLDVAVVVPERLPGGGGTIVSSEPAKFRHSGRIVLSAKRRRACP